MKPIHTDPLHEKDSVIATHSRSNAEGNGAFEEFQALVFRLEELASELVTSELDSANGSEKTTYAYGVQNSSFYQNRPAESENQKQARLADRASELYNFRRALDDNFDIDFISSSPACDILLDLFVQRSRHTKVSITSACIASGNPSTTALRWIQILVDRKYLARSPDPSDKRRVFLELTEDGHARLSAALSS